MAAGVNSQPGSIAVHSGGRVAYRGTDNQLHYCDVGTSYPWAVQNVVNQDGGSAYVAGDIIFQEAFQSIIYKGADDRLQYYWLNGNTYQHSWADDYWSTGAYTVSHTPKSVAISNGQLYYIGRDDNKLHQLTYNGNTNHWDPMILPSPSYAYDQTGYPMADRAFGGITSNAAGTRLTYVGQDGRLQSLSLNNGNWRHDWIDTYWNTGEYLSFSTSSATNQYSSVVATETGQAFYCGADQHLRCFSYEPCTNEYTYAICSSNSPVRGTLNRSALSVTTATTAIQLADSPFSVYPNPTNGTVDVLLHADLLSTPVHFTLYSSIGQVIAEGLLTTNTPRLQLGTYPNGVYLLRIEVAEKTYQTKLIKQ